MTNKEHQPIDTMAITFLKFYCLREWSQHLQRDTTYQIGEWLQERGYIIDNMIEVPQEWWNEVYKVEPHTKVNIFTKKEA